MNESVKDVGIEGAEILGQPDLGRLHVASDQPPDLSKLFNLSQSQ